MAKLDPEVQAHLEWIGFVRPTGLVVSAPALVRAGAILDRRDSEGQRLLRACVEERTFDAKEGPVQYVANFRAFAQSVLGWSFSAKEYGLARLPPREHGPDHGPAHLNGDASLARRDTAAEPPTNSATDGLARRQPQLSERG